jgi:arabinogalactan endo-1,4-beta-galactosidase
MFLKRLLAMAINGLILTNSWPVLSQNVILYQATFPYGSSGNYPVSSVGWANDIPDGPDRLYQNSGGDGAVYAYEGSSATTAFYTSTAIATNPGAAGMTFQSVNPALYPGLSFSVDICPYYTPANVTARFAVQMNGSQWFAAASLLPVPGTVGPFATYSMMFNPSAANWRALSVSGNGSGTGATIGAAASGNLAGTITGAGLVFVHTGSGGTFNFDNFLITATNIGNLTASSISNGVINLSWLGAANVRLQSSTNLTGGAWTDLLQTAGQSVATVSPPTSVAYFRLAAFSPGGLQDGGFESNSAYWQTSGDTASASFPSNGAYAGSFCLQHSNTVAYQTQTYQLATNLLNGYYKLTGMVQNSGGEGACYLSANNRRTALPIYQQWSNIVLRGISVTNGQCLVSLVSSRPAGTNWCRLDFLQLIKDDLPYAFLKGGDISELTYVEQGGGVFYETNGRAMDCLQIMTNHGCNIVRIRLYNDPGNSNYYPSSLLPPGIQNQTNVLDLAARAKALGLQIALTFYYSDYWEGGASFYKPHSWVGYSLPQLSNALYSFTTNFMTEMARQGTTPEYVSLGDEIEGGILLQDSTPTGQPIQTNNSPVNGSYTNFANLAQLLNAGYAAVKLVSPSSRVILHIGPVDSGSVEWFFNQCVAYGVNWDIIGCSYYPYWTGLTAEQAEANINTFQPVFHKPVMIMETGYNWSTNLCNGYPGQLANNGPEPFPSTQEGQKDFLLNCFNALKLAGYGPCISDLYWDPVFICVPGEGWELGQPNVVDNTTLFDFTGHALPALDAFDYNN